jgi:hypothetical protein
MSGQYRSYLEHEKERISFPDPGDSLSFAGKVSQDAVDSICRLIEKKFENDWSGSTKRKKVMTIIVEVLQNIYHHSLQSLQSDIDVDDAESGIIILRREGDDMFKLLAGNFLRSDDADPLLARINSVNAMTRDELKEFYRKKLAENEISEKGGAGLGIIEIARKSSQPIIAEIEEVKGKTSFITLDITV